MQNGWITPNGTFIPCTWAGHERILKEMFNISSVDTIDSQVAVTHQEILSIVLNAATWLDQHEHLLDGLTKDMLTNYLNECQANGAVRTAPIFFLQRGHTGCMFSIL